MAQVTKAPASLSTAAIGQMCASNQVVSNVVTTCPGSAKATTANSGNAAAQGSSAQTGLNNAQVAGAVAAGGTAPVVVQNSSSSRVDDTGSANAQTGLANAQGASPGATASPTAGTVGATSGNASANGLSAQNTVTNNTRAAVVVGGANNAEVNVASSNQVTVTDNGAASATSGAALASRASNPTGSAATGTLGATRAVASASMPAMVGTTTQINPHGLNASNAFQGTLSTTSTSAPTGPVTINHTEAVTIANNGNAAGTSTGACTGFGCNLPAAGLTGHSPVGTASSKPSSGVARATTGSATARGLVAQNTVNNQASVKVHINGSNYGIINVVVQTVTSIVNWGSAAAQSGSAAALGAATGGPTFVSPVPSPLGTTSENVQATGASVTNRVGLNSSISISTPGDNRNPIQIFVQLLTNLTNRGSSQAFSGTVQSIGSLTGSGTAGNDPTASATSGSVDATGLQVQNLVNLSSDVSINIGGSNYAPIDVYLLLETRIQNLGQALAVSGDARTLGGATAQTSAPSSSGSSSSSTGNASTTGAVGPGTVSATTGSSLASADVSVIEATNAQTAGVSATTPYRAALNAASYAFNTQGVASANSGTASTGPLPVGSATGQSTPPGSPAARQVGGISGAFGTGATPGNGPSLSWPISGASESGSNQNGVSGSVVGPGVVDLSLWAALPDPDAPPMPGQSVMHRSKVTRAQTTTSRVATTSTSIFELQPVPELMPPDAPAQQVQLRSASPSVAPSSSVQRTTVPAAHGTSSATAATTGNVWVTPIVILALILVAAAGLGTIAWRRRMPLGEMIQTALGSISLW